MNQSFYTGITGLNVSQAGLDVVGDNLANINNLGFKKSGIEFSSFYGEALDRSSSTANFPVDTGFGSQVQATPLILTQGNLIDGARDTELAIDGDGWFGVKGSGNVEYTRNGDFYFDASRDLVTHDRLHVLGTLGNNIVNGELTEQLSSVELSAVAAQQPLNFPEELTYPVEPTTEVKFLGNVSTNDETVRASVKAVSPNDDNNAITLTFTKQDPQPAEGSAWDIVAVATTNDGTETFDEVQGSATFASNGAMIGFDIPQIDNDGTLVTINLGSDFNGIFSNNLPTNVSSSFNGLESGDLVGYRVNQDANVIASFSNGRSSSVGKVAVFHFQNDQGLSKLSGSRFVESSNSGKPIFYQDANGNNITGANVLNYKLENSNVQAEVALTELIIFQNAFDASSKTISTSDQMIQKALQMDA